jgi:hypothetical protein
MRNLSLSLRWSCSVCLLGVLAGDAFAADATDSAARRVAVLVGANQASPGRRPLLHAHRDAERMADALWTVGRYRRDDVHLLRDPEPARLLEVIAGAARAVAGAPGTVLYFYYSGHADEQALYPAGRALPIETLRRALEATRASVRIGMIDACRGGGWTRTKGMTAEAPFEVKLPLNPGAEGTVLIASSSGLESAHESDVLAGSFFTTHFVAGLRGAADRSENGEVTLTEAFEHAKMLTIRDTARLARETQHPSFAMNLRGRQDLVLAQVAASPSTLTLAQASGPLEVIHLDTGAALLELAPGQRRVRVALPPGRYLVRRFGPGGTWAKEVQVSSAAPTQVAEAELTIAAAGDLAFKSKGPAAIPPLTFSTLPAHKVALGLATGLSFGWSHPVGMFGTSQAGQTAHAASSSEATLLWGLSDRLTWGIATGSFAYRFGERGGWELIPSGGVMGAGYSSIEGWILQSGLGLGARRWFGSEQALTVEAMAMDLYSDFDDLGARWFGRASLGWSGTLADRVTFNAAVGLWTDAPTSIPGQGPVPRTWSAGFGSVQVLGLRQLPLVELYLGSGFSLELHARIRREVNSSSWQYATLMGLAWVF